MFSVKLFMKACPLSGHSHLVERLPLTEMPHEPNANTNSEII
jgi:hypothetical protein